MVDWVVIVTPLLALGVLLLLGFAGCKYNPPPSEPNEVDIVVRVPTALTATEIVFRCVPPAGPLPDDTQSNPTPGSTEGGDNLLTPILLPPSRPPGTAPESSRWPSSA